MTKLVGQVWFTPDHPPDPWWLLFS